MGILKTGKDSIRSISATQAARGHVAYQRINIRHQQHSRVTSEKP